MAEGDTGGGKGYKQHGKKKAEKQRNRAGRECEWAAVKERQGERKGKNEWMVRNMCEEERMKGR